MVVVIKMGAYINGCLFCVGCLLSRFCGIRSIHDRLKDHLIEMIFNKLYTVWNVHKVFACMFVVDNIYYIMS